MPENAAYISTAPGKTGIIINTGGINIFDLPIIKVGIKNNKAVGAEKLVAKSNQIEQGREVAAIGVINSQGFIEQAGEIVVGGMGYVPSRLLVSEKLGQLVDEYEEVDQLFFEAETQVEEAEIRKKRYKIAHDFTGMFSIL